MSLLIGGNCSWLYRAAQIGVTSGRSVRYTAEHKIGCHHRSSSASHPHAGAGALLRTPWNPIQRIPPHQALGELGHHVDLVTYPIGRDVPLPNLRIFRSLRPPFITKVRIGPSRHQAHPRRAHAADRSCGGR